MKKILFALFVLLGFSVQQMVAQEKTTLQEFGLTFRSIESYGLTYKIGNGRSMWRINPAVIQFSKFKNDDQFQNTDEQFGGSFSFGRETRKDINPDFQLRYGIDLSAAYLDMETFYTNEFGDTYYGSVIALGFGANLVFGANVNLNDHLILGAEIQPELSYQLTNNPFVTSEKSGTFADYDQTKWNYGFNNFNALLSLAYRW